MPKSTRPSKALVKEAQSKKSVAKMAKKQPPPKSLSTETIEDSDREDESSAGDSDVESLPKNPVKAKAKPKTNGKVTVPTESSSSSGSESESDDAIGSSSEESVEEVVAPKAKKDSRDKTSAAKEPTSKVPKTNSHTPAAPYKPPPGFESTSITDPPEILREVKKAPSSGKQIWYFTAPAAVPISSIKDMSLLGIENGNVACSHNGDEYGFVQDQAEERKTTNVLIPNTSDDGYRAVSKPVDKVLHLTQIVKLPGASGTNEPTSKATIPAKKPVRPQPTGLKMRYLPLGCEGVGGTLGSTTSGETSDSDVEMEEAPKRFKNPAPLPTTSNPDHEMTEAPPLQKKSSKSHKSSKTDTATDVTTKKRKHGEKSEKKSKSSSSKSNEDNNDNQLKVLKKRQIILHNATAHERRISISPRLVPKKMTVVPPPPKPAHPTPLRSILKTSRPPQVASQEEARGKVKTKKRKEDKETSKTDKNSRRDPTLDRSKDTSKK
ncbi:DNA-directed RNA polymerase I subunit RPA34.5-domain-containing protein [Amylocarpus encephaloides]|uniref:DNA-directed RNA polymerase I subunit RPA34.5-domain-containing protein n=1 Tax=Amylocarpus encephaloides TaxID=45428 RepID=A0A9P8C8Z1_9HELO|nr:DNA-directed RNA polymerase I subunit RPA34.5-domain-containing protein [Amylocarpus encephaloides]